ncbi:MATE family efflux transporter [Lactovum odontotermitis]
MKQFKEINLYVLPLIATNLLQIIISQFSLAIATNNSKEIISAISVIQNFLFAFGGILGAFSLAFNILASRASAENLDKKFKNLIKSSFYLDCLIGGAFFIISILFGQFILRVVYGFQGELLRTASLYLAIMSPYIFLTLLMFLFSNLLKIERKTSHIFFIDTVSGLIELGLCYILVPRFGIIGAGTAVIFSLLFIVLVYFWDIKEVVLSAMKERANSRKTLLKLGLPLAIQEIFESVIFIVIFDAFMSRLGLRMLSIYAIVLQLFAIVRLPAYMYGGAVAVFVPEARKEQKMKSFIYILSSSSMLFYILLGALAIVFSKFFSLLFIHSQGNLSLHPYLEITILFMVFSPLYEMSKTFLQSSDCEKFVVSCTVVVNILCVLVLIGFQLAQKQSYTSLFSVYGLNILILSAIFIGKMKRLKNVEN